MPSSRSSAASSLVVRGHDNGSNEDDCLARILQSKLTAADARIAAIRSAALKAELLEKHVTRVQLRLRDEIRRVRQAKQRRNRRDEKSSGKSERISDETSSDNEDCPFAVKFGLPHTACCALPKRHVRRRRQRDEAKTASSTSSVAIPQLSAVVIPELSEEEKKCVSSTQKQPLRGGNSEKNNSTGYSSGHSAESSDSAHSSSAGPATSSILALDGNSVNSGGQSAQLATLSECLPHIDSVVAALQSNNDLSHFVPVLLKLRSGVAQKKSQP